MSKQPKKSGATIKVAAYEKTHVGKASRARSGLGATISVLDAMDAYRKQVTASPEASAAFLTQLGVLDEKGNLLTLCS
jgi:hypothetical protein